jgi:Mrp family chromosome partitioning ATPase
MARILDALRKGDAFPRAEPASLPRPYRPDDVAPKNLESAEEIPFIEVGGKNSPMEASPSVLASAPKLAPAPTLPEPRPGHSAAVKSLLDRSVSGVRFTPVPAERAPVAPARERFAPELIAFHQPEHPLSRQYQVLAETLANQLSPAEPHVVLFAAGAPGLDTVEVVLNLAITQAGQPDSRIAVIDADFHESPVAGRLGLSPAPGLQDVLAGRKALKSALQETGHDRLLALTVGRALDDGAHPLASEAMKSILRHLRNRFDWVFISGTCWDGRPDLVALGAVCDAVYILLPEERAESLETQAIVDLISEQGSKLRGCIYLRAG